MPLAPSQLEILADQIIILADVIALIAAQAEVGEAGETAKSSDSGKDSKNTKSTGNLDPTELNILSAELTVLGDWLALVAALEEAQTDK